MDIDIREFTDGGKLSKRAISTEEEELSWDLSSCQHECYEGKNKFKSPEFSSAEASWVLFMTFDPNCISFGILSVISSTSVEVFDCCCSISYRNLDNEVFKSSELKFKCGEDMPFIGMKDFFSLKNSADAQLNVLGSAVIGCRFNAKRSVDTTCSSKKRDKKFSNLYVFNRPLPFLTKSSIYRGKLTSQIISTEEELIWDVSSCVANSSSPTPLCSMCPEFSFAGATWYLETKLHRNFATFGIHVRKLSSSDEVFDCCCNISLQNSKGKLFEYFELKFKCDKAMPLISMSDGYCISQQNQGALKPEEGILIICRISSKKLTVTKAYSSAEIAYSFESSVVEVNNSVHRREQKDDESTIVNPVYKVCQDLRRLLQSEEGSDVILQVGDHPSKAHRTILSARSSVFDSMFHHNMKEKATGVVNVEDCDASSFPALLDFLYSGSTDKISRENVFGLYTSSDKYDVQDLKMECLEFIKNNLSVATFCETVRLSLRHSENELLKLAINFFAKNFKEIIVTVKWQDFILENPIQSNEILIKALASGAQDN